MAWSHVQGGGAHATGSTDAPQFTFSSPPAIGNLIVVGVAQYNTTAGAPLSDNLGHSYTNLVDLLANQVNVQIWYTIVTHNSAPIVLQWGVLAFAAMACDEFAPPGTPATDGTAQNSGTNASPTSGSLTLTGTDLVYGCVSVGNSEGSHTAGSGYTPGYSLGSVSSSNLGIAVEWKLNTTGPENPSFTLGASPSAGWTMGAAAFKATSAWAYPPVGTGSGVLNSTRVLRSAWQLGSRRAGSSGLGSPGS